MEALSVLRAECPDVRFADLIVGATDGTEIGSERDPDLVAAMAPEWIRRGLFKDGFL